jgi:hypothetical protein
MTATVTQLPPRLYFERQPAGTPERRQVDVGDAAYGIVVQDQAALDVHGTGAIIEVCLAEIGSGAVQYLGPGQEPGSAAAGGGSRARRYSPIKTPNEAGDSTRASWPRRSGRPRSHSNDPGNAQWIALDPGRRASRDFRRSQDMLRRFSHRSVPS